MISEEENDALGASPDTEEVKKAVFRLNGDSASGLDGLTERFYQTCWDIVGSDIVRMVKDFFAGCTLLKSITHTNKKANFQIFSDLRSISLSNFINKILSRIVHDPPENILPKVISSNQPGFVRDRSIIKNVFLTQEVVTDINNIGSLIMW